VQKGENCLPMRVVHAFLIVAGDAVAYPLDKTADTID
jgi:hypothetical protein